MAIYTKQKGIKNSTAYKKDKRFVKTVDVPVEVVELLKTQDEVDDSMLNTSAKFRKCIFCGEHSKNERFINGRTVYLCDDDYYSKNIGQIAEKLNKSGRG